MTKREAIASAKAVFEARIIVAQRLSIRSKLGENTDRELYDLEHKYWRQADEAQPNRPRRGKRKR